MIAFTAPVKPMGAVRMTTRGKFVKESAQRYTAYKRAIGIYAIKQRPKKIEGPVAVTLDFYYPIPSRFNKGQKEAAENRELFPVVKPDIDNCEKAIFDALKGIAWNDDNQVVKVTASKYYSKEPRVEVVIKPAGGV